MTLNDANTSGARRKLQAKWDREQLTKNKGGKFKQTRPSQKIGELKPSKISYNTIIKNSTLNQWESKDE